MLLHAEVEQEGIGLVGARDKWKGCGRSAAHSIDRQWQHSQEGRSFSLGRI